jgi:hypothetical protein
MEKPDEANLRYWQEKYLSMEKRTWSTWNSALMAAETAFGARHEPMCTGKHCLRCMCAGVLDSVKKDVDTNNSGTIVERMSVAFDERRRTLKIRGIARDKYLEGMQDMLRVAAEIIGDLR